MRLKAALAAALSFTTLCAAQEEQTLAFQSDIRRLMNVVVSHLYHHRDVFLRELVSNAGDAIEKTRLMALTDRSILDIAPELNISVQAYPESNTIVIRDTGLGMTREELGKNLGTIARSGTSEFLQKIEAGGDKSSNLIGQFGLGFYSSFLVADKVEVASKSNADNDQWIFESQADAAEFKIKKDPRGASLGRGTEITLHLRDDAKEYLQPETLKHLIAKHSTYSTSSPIWVWQPAPPPSPKIESASDDSVPPADEEDEEIAAKWVQVNDQPPIWMRDPKSVSDEDYVSFYKATYKDDAEPLFWTHFSGDAGSTAFKALVYMPAVIPNDIFSKNYIDLEAVRLYVRRVFITSDLGPTFWPKWLQFAKVIIDADDLPLNVGRDSLQANRALKQIEKNVLKKTIDTFTTFSSSTDEAREKKYQEFYKVAGSALKLGAHDDIKLRNRLMKLLRFESSYSNFTTLDNYVERRRLGQKQIFFAASAGSSSADLAKSPFVEKIISRGYEVVWFLEPLDEMLQAAIRSWEGMTFQDVAKKGLKFGDEDEKEKEEEEHFKEQFKPLIEYFKKELSAVINEVLISTRLTTSPCVITADQFAWTGNMERLMAAQNNAREQDSMMTDFFRNAKKILEINPRHPLIEGLLERVEENTEDTELRDTVLTLYDTSAVRSGFSLKDADGYFQRIDQLLRKTLGVRSDARAVLPDLKAAPEVEQGPVQPDTSDPSSIPNAPEMQPEWADWKDIKDRMGESSSSPLEDSATPHDEL